MGTFNRFGNPVRHGIVDNLAEEIYNHVSELAKCLIADHTVVELRAINQFLTSSVDVAIAEVILEWQRKTA